MSIFQKILKSIKKVFSYFLPKKEYHAFEKPENTLNNDQNPVEPLIKTTACKEFEQTNEEIKTEAQSPNIVELLSANAANKKLEKMNEPIKTEAQNLDGNKLEKKEPEYDEQGDFDIPLEVLPQELTDIINEYDQTLDELNKKIKELRKECLEKRISIPERKEMKSKTEDRPVIFNDVASWEKAIEDIKREKQPIVDSLTQTLEEYNKKNPVKTTPKKEPVQPKIYPDADDDFDLDYDDDDASENPFLEENPYEKSFRINRDKETLEKIKKTYASVLAEKNKKINDLKLKIHGQEITIQGREVEKEPVEKSERDQIIPWQNALRKMQDSKDQRIQELEELLLEKTKNPGQKNQ